MGMESTIKFTELKNSKEKRSLFVQVCGCHCYLCITTGEMAEWSIAAVLKTAVPQGTGGSNPSLSAFKRTRSMRPGFLCEVFFQSVYCVHEYVDCQQFA